MKEKPRIVFGIEFELEYDKDRMTIPSSGYHETSVPSRFGRFYCAEHDGSLRRRAFTNSRTVEIISEPFDAEDSEEIIEDFITTMIDMSGTDELRKAIEFNDSTGCHIHVYLYEPSEKKRLSVKDNDVIQISGRTRDMLFAGKPLPLKVALNRELMKRIRNRVFLLMKDILGSRYSSWYGRYFRRYARKVNLRSPGRNCEFNLTLNGKCRIEYRSYHLMGIYSWRDFRRAIYGT